MPQIPGVSTEVPAVGAKSLGVSPALRLVAGLLAVVVLLFVVSRWLFHSRQTEAVAPAPPAQIEVPTPPAEPASAIPRATAANPQIATVAEMAKPWTSKEFLFVDQFSNESTPALLIRLSGGSASQPEGYWALVMTAPFGSCRLEYVDDVGKLKEQYDFAGTPPYGWRPLQPNRLRSSQDEQYSGKYLGPRQHRARLGSPAAAGY